MLLSDLLFQGVVAFVWILVQLPFNIFGGVASSLISGAVSP
jgi:hypothetical protein